MNNGLILSSPEKRPFKIAYKASLFFAAVVISAFFPLTALAGTRDAALGYWCPPKSSTVLEGGSYTFTSGAQTCNYTLNDATFTTSGIAFDTYVGTLGVSTLKNGHFISPTCNSGVCSITQTDDWGSRSNGDNLFVVAYPSTDFAACRTFFTTGAGSCSGNNYGVIRWTWGTGGDPVIDTSTHIQTVQPAGGSTIATSTGATFRITGYVNPSDYESGMYVQVQYAIYSSYQAAVATPDLLFTKLSLPISSSGAFDLSTTSPVVAKGQYTMQTQLRTSSWVNGVLNFFGLGQFANLGIRSATSTQFYAVGPNAYDTVVASTTQSVNDYLASSTISISSCAGWTSFNLLDCLNLMFIPQAPQIVSTLDTFKNTFLSYAPWGYLTRFLVIVSGSATTSLPSFTVAVPIGADGDMSTTSITYDMQDMIQGGSNLLTSITTRDGTNRNVRDIVEPWIKLFVALSVVIVIVRDIGKVGTENRHNMHNGRE